MDEAFPKGMTEEIERFLAEDSKRPPGLDLYEDVFNSGLFFPLQRQAEMRRMIQIARSVSPATVMEIGADKGGGVYHWVKCLPSVERMIACEIRGTPYAGAFERAFPSIKFCWMPQSSRPVPFVEVRDPVMANHKIDVLFIDGDKSAFFQDFKTYRPLVSDRGVVFMHDINEGGSRMRAAFEAVKARGYRTEEIIDVSDSIAAVDRERAGIAPANAHEAWLRHWHGRSCGVGVIWMQEGLR